VGVWPSSPTKRGGHQAQRAPPPAPGERAFDFHPPRRQGGTSAVGVVGARFPVTHAYQVALSHMLMARPTHHGRSSGMEGEGAQPKALTAAAVQQPTAPQPTAQGPSAQPGGPGTRSPPAKPFHPQTRQHFRSCPFIAPPPPIPAAARLQGRNHCHWHASLTPTAVTSAPQEQRRLPHCPALRRARACVLAACAAGQRHWDSQ